MTFAPMRIGQNEFASKDFFHENVIKSLAEECDDDTGVYMIMMSIKEELRIDHRFGYIWKDEIINNYKEQVENLLGESGQFCRYSPNRFLVYLHCQHEKDIQEFIKRQFEYKSLLFHLKNIFDFKIMRLKTTPDRIKRLSDENRLYIEYFKAITKLERSKGKEMIVEVL